MQILTMSLPQVAGSGQTRARDRIEANQGREQNVQQYQTSLGTLGDIVACGNASEREVLVSQALLEQARRAETTVPVDIMRGAGFRSRCLAVQEGLSYLATGGATVGPMGAVLADLGLRQMDTVRVQTSGRVSPRDLRDSNALGLAMLQQIGSAHPDGEVQKLAAPVLEKLGKRYQDAPDDTLLDCNRRQFESDSLVLSNALEEIKLTCARGERDNPKCLALLEGPEPRGLGFGRSDGSSVSYPYEAGQGFGKWTPVTGA